MGEKIFLALILVLFSSVAEAQTSNRFKLKKRIKPDTSFFTQDSFFVGHSLTQTSYTLPQGKWMAGTFAVGYGLTHNLTLGSSPWLVAIYNTPNVIFRAKQDLSYDLTLGFHGGYMRSEPILANLYDMELYYSNLILSKRWSSRIVSHFTANLMYFLREETPFSIRVANPEEPTQISFSSLHEFYFKDGSGLALELGVLGANHSLPYVHGGVSLFYKARNYLVQLGLSVSATNNFRFSDLSSIGDTLESPDNEFKEIITHPEVQLQYYF